MITNSKSQYYYQFINFEHELSSNRNPFEKSFVNYPPEYAFFIRNTTPEVHNYYRYWLIEKIPVDKSRIHADILSFLNGKVISLNKKSIAKINDTNFIKKLNRRRNTSYSHFTSYVPQDIISHPLLQTYTKSYENTEILLIWLDIVHKLNKNLCIDKKSYTNQRGRIQKGSLVYLISDNLKKDLVIKKIFDTAYPKKFRNLVDHNDIYIDDEKNLRVIEDDKLFMRKDKFFETLYAIQTLHNLTVIFAVKQTINYNKMINQGFICAATFFYGNNALLFDNQIIKIVSNRLKIISIKDYYGYYFKNTLLSSKILNFYRLTIDIFQLQPFFELDMKYNQKLNNFQIDFSNEKAEDDSSVKHFLNIKTNNHLITKIHITPIVLLWYISNVKKKINIYSCKSLYFFNESSYIVGTPYGLLDINFKSQYEANQSK